MNRRQNFQTIAWFWDLYGRNRLNLDPPYQRRSVWNQAYKDSFIETLLLGFPAPAIFLYEEIEPSGMTKYNVVDGKQRLTAIFEFAKEEFPVSDQSELTALRGKSFSQLDLKMKTDFWSYQFSVEYLPSSDESIINNIFHRINKNVAKLTAQELRHAKLSGVFMTVAQDLAEWMEGVLPKGFPRIDAQSRRQMKDVELTAQLLLLLEQGPQSYSQYDLDDAFSRRDIDWEARNEVEDRFRKVVQQMQHILAKDDSLARTRLRNQADFYSLVGSLDAVLRRGAEEPLPEVEAERLGRFIQAVDDDASREQHPDVKRYYEAARSASNDAGPRRTRIEILTSVLEGRFQP